MATYIDTENLKFSYNLIRIAEASYKLFLKADNPEVKMLGILANFGKEDSYEAVKAVVDQVQSFTKGDFAESRYFKQLRIFVQLRSSIEQQFEKAMETITKFFKEENDFLYRKGREEERLKFVTKLVAQSGLSDEQIADLAEAPLNVVKSVRDRLKK